MTNELRRIYEKAGLLYNYFDETTPCDLFRGQSGSEAKLGFPIIYPNPGFTTRDGSKRPADVMIVERDGMKFVLGCVATTGHHRGISTFDAINPLLRNFRWYRLREGTKIPPALAITRDTTFKNKPNHYTIAPINDMPLDLFLALIQELCEKLEPI